MALTSSRSARTSSRAMSLASPVRIRPGGRGGSASSATTSSSRPSSPRPRSAALRSLISFFVAPLLGGEDARQRQLEDLEAALDLAARPHLPAVLRYPLLHDPGEARPAEQLGRLGPDRAHVVVDRLAPGQDQLRLLELHHRGERPGGRERVGTLEGGVVDVDGPVGAHGEAGTERLPRPLGPPPPP